MECHDPFKQGSDQWVQIKDLLTRKESENSSHEKKWFKKQEYKFKQIQATMLLCVESK